MSAISRAGSKLEQQVNVGVVFFFWWFVWKECNQRIFEHRENSAPQVANLIKDALAAYRRASAPA
jgi:hypothetical protein